MCQKVPIQAKLMMIIKEIVESYFAGMMNISFPWLIIISRFIIYFRLSILYGIMFYFTERCHYTVEEHTEIIHRIIEIFL
jgi:hypothetical protein